MWENDWDRKKKFYVFPNFKYFTSKLSTKNFRNKNERVLIMYIICNYDICDYTLGLQRKSFKIKYIPKNDSMQNENGEETVLKDFGS